MESRTSRGGGRPSTLLALAAVFATALAACGEAGGDGGEGLPGPGPAPELRPSDGLLESPVLQEVVDLQVRRHGPALADHLDHEDPAVRARAAFALASVDHGEAEPALTELLRDPVAAVRRDAAFALGHLGPSDGGRALVEALEEEEDPEALGRLVEAVGRAGDAEVVEELLALDPEAPPLARARALALAALGGAHPDGLVPALVRELRHPEPEVRDVAAAAFGRMPEPDPWEEHADGLREALDSYAPDEPAAMHLLLALGRKGEEDDRDRILRWLEEGEDWRIRVNAARALGALPWIEREGVRAALFRTLDDGSDHVGVAAARSLTAGLWVPPDVLARMEDRIRGPEEAWRAHVPFLRQLARFHAPEAVLEWTRRMVDVHPAAVGHGLAALAEAPGAGFAELVLELAEHEDPEVRVAAHRILAQRWQTVAAGGEARVDRLHGILDSAVRDGTVPEAVHAAHALAQPPFLERGSLEALQSAYRRQAAEGPAFAAGRLLELLAQVGDPESLEMVEEALEAEDPSLRRAAARALMGGPGDASAVGSEEVEAPERSVDWGFLGSLGPEPRLRVETERGELVVRLAPEEAPLTVQTVVRQAEEGLHDGVPFHRVEPNFVTQGGDVAMGDGSGGPGYAIRREITGIPFTRGVLGMASAGPDTEGSQFFLTHSTQLHLDGEMTAFGWVESGHDVLDRIGEGDRVERMIPVR